VSTEYRRVAFFRKIAIQVSAQVRYFRPRPSVWLSDWLSTRNTKATGSRRSAESTCVSKSGRRLRSFRPL